MVAAPPYASQSKIQSEVCTATPAAWPQALRRTSPPSANDNSRLRQQNNVAALSASDQWMPSQLPTSPIVTPLNMRIPKAAMEYTPMTRPRMAGGARNCTSVCAIELNDSSTNPATNSSTTASGYTEEMAKPASVQHQII